MSSLQRPFDYEVKGKKLLVVKDRNNVIGLSIVSPKRGGSAKIYPVYGTESAIKRMIQTLSIDLKKMGLRKIYTFTHIKDGNLNMLLTSEDFTKRGELRSAYKSGHNLYIYDVQYLIY